jgi:hypothetical protein
MDKTELNDKLDSLRQLVDLIANAINELLRENEKLKHGNPTDNQ